MPADDNSPIYITTEAISSFGGHKAEAILSNIGKATNGKDNISELKNTRIIIVEGTNDGDDIRSFSYVVQLVEKLRDLGCKLIYGLSPFWGVRSSIEEKRNSVGYLARKALFGGHFIDQVNVISYMGLYFNLYHAKKFVQPGLNENVDITFEDLDAQTECGLIKVDNYFYIRYSDTSFDKYKCISIDSTNNTITAKLVENSSTINKGMDAGEYTEDVSTSVISLRQTIYGYLYNEADLNAYNKNMLPPSVYKDNTVHFGKIFKRIINAMLFTSGINE